MRVQLVIAGRVQGVGFRLFTAASARGLGLTGSARNLPNGQVHITAEGDRSALEALIEAVRRGPLGAEVRDVRIAWEDAPAQEREFQIR